MPNGTWVCPTPGCKFKFVGFIADESKVPRCTWHRCNLVKES